MRSDRGGFGCHYFDSDGGAISCGLLLQQKDAGAKKARNRFRGAHRGLRHTNGLVSLLILTVTLFAASLVQEQAYEVLTEIINGRQRWEDKLFPPTPESIGEGAYGMGFMSVLTAVLFLGKSHHAASGFVSGYEEGRGTVCWRPPFPVCLRSHRIVELDGCSRFTHLAPLLCC